MAANRQHAEPRFRPGIVLDAHAVLVDGRPIAFIPASAPELMTRLAGALAASLANVRGSARQQLVLVRAESVGSQTFPVAGSRELLEQADRRVLAALALAGAGGPEREYGQRPDPWQLIFLEAAQLELDEPAKAALTVLALASRDPRAVRAARDLYYPQTRREKQYAHACRIAAEHLIRDGKAEALTEIFYDISVGNLQGYRAILSVLRRTLRGRSPGIEAESGLREVRDELRERRAQCMTSLRRGLDQNIPAGFAEWHAWEAGLLACEHLLSLEELTELLQEAARRPAGVSRMVARMGRAALETGRLPKDCARDHYTLSQIVERMYSLLGQIDGSDLRCNLHESLKELEMRLAWPLEAGAEEEEGIRG